MTSSFRKMNLIVAIDSEGGIGKNGTLPWKLKKDMQYFAKMTKLVEDSTKKNAVVMGRKCWESIPENRRPLPNRLNIVLSRALPQTTTENLIIMNNFEDMLRLLSSPPYVHSVETIWNIGGAEIYDLAIQKDVVDTVYVTHIHKSYEADVYLKGLQFEKMKKIENEAEDSHENPRILEEEGVKFEFCKWKFIDNQL